MSFDPKWVNPFLDKCVALQKQICIGGIWTQANVHAIAKLPPDTGNHSYACDSRHAEHR